MPRPPLTFDRFLPLPENRSALAAVRQAAATVINRRPAPSLNPLFLHGPAGSGKTHLVSALVEDVTRQAPDVAVTLLTAADLETLAGAADDLRAETADALRAARTCDLVVVEDLHRLTARPAEALVGLLNHLLPRQAQVVVTAAVGPRHLELPARLTSRLAEGLVVGLEPLQASGRLALLRDLAARRGLAVADDVLAWLAENLTGG